MNILNRKAYIGDLETACNLDLPWQKLAGKTILLTGATGLICSCIADILLWKNKNSANSNTKLVFAGRSRERTALRFEPFKEGKDYIFADFEAASGNAPEIDFKVDYIIHGASNAHPAAYSKQPVETMLANLLGTNALLRMALENQTSRLLYISSSEVYGKRDGFLAYDEQDYGYIDLLNPRSCYPSSKRAAETLIASYAHEYGVDGIIARPGHIFGPTATLSDTRVSSAFFRDVLAHRDIVMKSAGAQLRSYCYVIDCATAILAIMLSGKTGEAYNIGIEDSTATIRELAEMIAKVSGQKVVFGDPTEQEKKSFNAMDNSSLSSRKLENLGWKGQFDVWTGVVHTYEIMRDGYK